MVEFPDMKGFSETNLHYIHRWFLFYNKGFSNSGTACARISSQVVAELTKIPWGHNRVIISKCNNTEDAFFYVQKTIKGTWCHILTGRPRICDTDTWCSKSSKSIWDAKKNGSLVDLYSRYNKNKLHQMMLFPTCTNHEKERSYTATQNDKYLQGNVVSKVSRMIGQVSKTVTQQRITLSI